MKSSQRFADALQRCFANNNVAPEQFAELLSRYADSGLSPPHLPAEIETGDEGKAWSYIWEAMLYSHLSSMGYSLRSSVASAGQLGPDFCVNYQDRTIWIEAIVPSPEGIPSDWLAPLSPGVPRMRTKPDEQRVLRCTSAIYDKQKKFAEYQHKGIVGKYDCTVIAINICRLSEWDVDGCGISQLPLTMEAVLPIGSLGLPMTREGKVDGPMQHIPRFAIKKASGSDVQTANFLDPLFANVSAVIQNHQKGMPNKNLQLSMIHNPLADNRLPRGLFGVSNEFVAEQQQDGTYLVTNVAISS